MRLNLLQGPIDESGSLEELDATTGVWCSSCKLVTSRKARPCCRGAEGRGFESLRAYNLTHSST